MIMSLFGELGPTSSKAPAPYSIEEIVDILRVLPDHNEVRGCPESSVDGGM
jgi:hypothetical protein